MYGIVIAIKPKDWIITIIGAWYKMVGEETLLIIQVQPQRPLAWLPLPWLQLQ